MTLFGCTNIPNRIEDLKGEHETNSQQLVITSVGIKKGPAPLEKSYNYRILVFRHLSGRGGMLLKKSYLLLVFIGISSNACSLSSYPTLEGLVGTLAGAGAGAGVGHLIGSQIGNEDKNMAISAGVGAVSGLAIGALIHDQRAQLAKEEEAIIREAKMIGERQKEIDDIREEVYSESSWGRLEVKPWHERYQSDPSEYPYQSPK